MDEDDPQKAGENVAQSGLRSGQSAWGSTQGPVYFGPLASFTSSPPSSTTRWACRGRASPMHEPGRRSARLTVQRHWCKPPPTGAMTIENGTAIVLAYVLVSMGVIIAFLLAAFA